MQLRPGALDVFKRHLIACITTLFLWQRQQAPCVAGAMQSQCECCDLLQTRPVQRRATPQGCARPAKQWLTAIRSHARQHQGRKGMDCASRLDVQPLVPPIGVNRDCCESCSGLAKILEKMNSNKLFSASKTQCLQHCCFVSRQQTPQVCSGHILNTTQ